MNFGLDFVLKKGKVQNQREEKKIMALGFLNVLCKDSK